MKFRIVFFFCVFTCGLTQFVRAQDVFVSILLDSLNMNGVARQQLLYADDSITVLLQIKAKKGYIVKFRNCCGEVKRTEVADKLDTEHGMASFWRAEQSGANIVLFYNGSEASGRFIYGQRIDMHTFVAAPAPDLLADNVFGGELSLEISPDHSKLLIHYEIKEKAKAALFVRVYSADLNLIWNKLNYEHPDAFGGAGGYAVNDNGDVAYLNVQTVSEAALNRPSGKKIRCCAINWFKESGNTYAAYFFDDDGLLFLDYRTVFTADGAPELIAYYRMKAGTEIGVLTALPGEKSAAIRNLYHFSDEFVTASMSEEDKKRYLARERTFRHYLFMLRINDVIVGTDKAIYVVGEVRDYSAQNLFSYKLAFGNGTPAVGAKINSEIIAMKIDADHRQVWVNRITRAFLLDGNTGGTASAVRCFEFSGCLAIVFNDHPANNVLRSSTDQLHVAQDGDGSIGGVVYVFNKDGEPARTDFAGSDDNPFVFDASKWSRDEKGAVVFWSGTNRAEFIRLSERK